MEDFIDVLSPRGLRTGEISLRSEIHRLGKPHRAIHLYIFNSKNEVLLQRRASTTDHLPGVFSISVTGHIVAGYSSMDTVKKELEEELGINAAECEIDFIFSFYQEAVLSETYIDKQFNDIYMTKIDIDPLTIKFDSKEVDEVKFVALDDFREMVSASSGKLAPYYMDECRDLFYFIEKKLINSL